MAKETNDEDVFNLKDTQANSYLNKNKQNDDGILRPKLEEGKDGIRQLVIRFLPNLTKAGKIESTSVEKHIHYADFKEHQELQGYFDCLKNVEIGKDCPLCKTYWALKNSKNPKDEEKAKKINRSTKYYAYVQVVEDKQKPENEGKIFIFPYGYKIYQKIKAMATNTRKPITVEDLVYGANMVLIIEEKAGFYNYDGSYFESPEPITINGKPLKVDADGGISSSEKAKAIEFLKSRTVDLDDYKAQEWSSVQIEKADKIIAMLTGQSYDSGSNDVNYNKADNKKPLTSADIFDSDDDNDDDDDKKSKAKSEKKETPKENEKKSNDDLGAAKRKAAAFFDDDDN